MSIFDFLKTYDKSRFHIPAHKGTLSPFDITEVVGSDSLYEANGIIEQAECVTAKLFKATHTSYSAGGSTLCIQTMISLVAKPSDVIIATRNAHRAFINVCGLLDITLIWIDDNEKDLSAIIDLTLQTKKVAAVYLTTPDYFGNTYNIKSIAAVCCEHHTPLLVDNAHGAYLAFSPINNHPLNLGATLCCDSAYKTLPCLTGGAYLHYNACNNILCDISKRMIKDKMALFGSTSPSYLVLNSLDRCNSYLQYNAKDDFLALYKKINELEIFANSRGYSVSNSIDYAKLIFNCDTLGITSDELYKMFIKFNIEPEYIGNSHIVLMTSPFNSKKDFSNLYALMETLNGNGIYNNVKHKAFTLPKAAMSIRDAIFARCVELPISESIGKISAQTISLCPPGTAIIVAGEIVDEAVVYKLKLNHIADIKVVADK